MGSRSLNMYSSLMRSTKGAAFPAVFLDSPARRRERGVGRRVILRRKFVCLAVKESPIATAPKETMDGAKEAPAKPKRVAPKVPAKPLPELMEEEVIPQLKAILEAQQDLSEIELCFQDNKLEGSFLKSGSTPHYFWAFFPDGLLTGSKGFAMSSNGLEASTVEPFLIDEKKISGKHVVFWVEKRLAAQGILPVWK